MKQVLMYSRPREVDMHLRMAELLRHRWPEAPIRFVTFFSAVEEMARHAGYDAVYLPDALRQVTRADVAAFDVRALDEMLMREYDAGWKTMLMAERFLPRDRARAVEFGRRHAVVLDRLIRPVTLSISSMFDHYVYWLAGSLANARGGAHFAFVGSGCPPGHQLALRTPWERWHGPCTVERATLLLEESRRLLDIPAHERISYMRRDARPSLSWRERIVAYRHRRRDVGAGSYFPFISPQAWIALKLLPAPLHRALVSHPEPRYDVTDTQGLDRQPRPYVFMPLHMEPEAVLLMYSPWLRDQREAVRLVAQSLPAEWALLVKENPKMRRQRPRSWFRDLRAMPGVRLVDPEVPATDLIRGAEAVVSISGTATLEARVLGKPGVCLGRAPFRNLLSASDFAGGGLALERLRDALTARPSPIDVAAWTDYCASVFPLPGSALDRDPEIIEPRARAHAEFIMAALSSCSGGAPDGRLASRQDACSG